jgi:hypothetical protein
VGKPTIYRRYAGKAVPVAATGTGDLRQALVQTVGWLAEQIAEQEVGLLGALLAATRSRRRSPRAHSASCTPVTRTYAATARSPRRTSTRPPKCCS